MLVPGSRGFIALLAALTALTAMSTDMSLPALPRLAEVFAASPDDAQLTLSIFLLGFAIGQPAYGPLSDRFGRRPVLLFGLALYTIAGIGCALSLSIGQLIACRLLQGIGGCVARVLGPAIVRDEFDAQRGAQILSYVMLVFALAPLLAPMAGGYLLLLAGWRAIFGVLAAIGLALLLVSATRFAESSKYRDHSATRLDMLLRNYRRFLGHRVCLGYMLVNCFGFAGMFSYISGSSFVFVDVFGVSNQLYGVLFGVSALSYMVGSSLNTRLLRRHAPRRLLALGLAVGLAGGAAMLFCAAFNLAGLLGVLLPFMVLMAGMAMVYPNATAGAMGPMPEIAGVASSLIGSTQVAMGALAGYLVTLFYAHSALSMACGVAGSALLACLTYLALLRGQPA